MTAERRLPILIAEDSEDNRFLLQAYCQKTAYDLTFAEDGEQAVSAYQTSSFDIVIMDIQMPNMDGLSATRLIRQYESESGARRTPVLALTANVMPHDVDASLMAGCDLHLAKPISRKTFLDALEKWSPKRESISAPAVIQEGLEPYALSYLAARRQELPLLLDLLRRCEFDEIRRTAHNWKGTGTSYGFPEITRLGAGLEEAGVNRDSKNANGIMQTLAEYLEVAGQQLRRA